MVEGKEQLNNNVKLPISVAVDDGLRGLRCSSRLRGSFCQNNKEAEV